MMLSRQRTHTTGPSLTEHTGLTWSIRSHD